MPKAVPVTYADFLKIEEELVKKRGFREMSRFEIGVVLQFYNKEPRNIFITGEVGFCFTVNGYTLKVWTSCARDKVAECRRASLETPLLKKEIGDRIVSHPPGKDMGWVVIVDQANQAQYFARPTLRTKGFVTTFLRRTWITWWKIFHRQKCPKCGAFMDIRRKADHKTFWTCFNRSQHENGKPTWAGWDKDLPPNALKFAKSWRKEYLRYRKAELAEGNIPRRASTIRKRWK